MNSISERLQYLVDVKNVVQQDVANGTGINRSRISELLNGKVDNPRRSTVKKLADYFRCNIEWLATGKGEPFLQGHIAEPLQFHVPESISSNTRRHGEDHQRPKNGTVHAHLPNKSMQELAAWINEQNDGIDYWEVAKAKMAIEFPEFREWLKKRAGQGGAATLPEAKSVNGEEK